MSHRGCIRATQGQRLLHRLLQAFPTVPLAEREQLDHLPRAWVFAMPFLQTQPQPVETLRPPSAFAPLPQRTRSRQRSRFLLQHVEIVLQIENLLIAPDVTLPSPLPFPPPAAGDSIPPALPVSSPARRDSAPDRAPAHSARNCARAAPRTPVPARSRHKPAAVSLVGASPASTASNNSWCAPSRSPCRPPSGNWSPPTRN